MRVNLDNSSRTLAIPAVELGWRRLAVACALLALAAAFLVMGPFRAAWAQGGPGCAVTDLGTLGADASAELASDGQWTTAGCDSRFRPGSDARTYRFEVVEGGRIRVDLTSDDGDSHLYLLDEDGVRITDNDDGGAGLDARVEQDLEPGVYLVEATTVGGRGRGAAKFSLSISRASGCEPVHLGSLEPGVDLTASGSWTLDTCGSTFVVQHPAYNYLFDLPEGGRVRIDLMSENGDPVLSLASLSKGLIAANDDGGERRNSRIQTYLQADTYRIEATTYLERDYQPLMADFNLLVRLIDEKAKQESFLLKIEEAHTPEYAVAGQPFPVHFRVGNLGGGGLDEVGGRANLYVVGPRVYEWIAPIAASEDRWQGGVSYHTGPQTATDTSISIDEVTPFEVTLTRAGPSWVFVAVITYDWAGEEVGFHGQWKNIMVLSGTTFDEVTVNVDGVEHSVAAEADVDGIVTTSVSAVDDPDADVDSSVRAKAIYAAGVHTQALNGIFDRPGIEVLDVEGEAESVSVDSPSSSDLLKRFADRYTGSVSASGLADALTAEEMLNPIAIEDLTLEIADAAAAQFVSLAESWSALQDGLDDGETLSFEDAFSVHSQLAYAERVVSPSVTAGKIVEAARASEMGWDDPDVQAMVDDLEGRASCRGAEASLRGALEEAGAADVAGLLNLDAEVRIALPVYGLGRDAALCAAADADEENTLFLEGLSIDDDTEILEMFGYEQPSVAEVAPRPHRLRIIARLGEDGRIEHGVELSGGEQILPSRRQLSADAKTNVWLYSSDVEVDGDPIGRIRSRRLADGRVELGFLATSNEAITPGIRYLPAEIPAGVWLRSGEIEVMPEPALE